MPAYQLKDVARAIVIERRANVERFVSAIAGEAMYVTLRPEDLEVLSRATHDEMLLVVLRGFRGVFHLVVDPDETDGTWTLSGFAADRFGQRRKGTTTCETYRSAADLLDDLASY